MVYVKAVPADHLDTNECEFYSEIHRAKAWDVSSLCRHGSGPVQTLPEGRLLHRWQLHRSCSFCSTTLHRGMQLSQSNVFVNGFVLSTQ